MPEKKEGESLYARHGYKDRKDYLKNLADNHGVEESVVHMMADVLGDSEDFDGLVTELEDMDCAGLLDGFRKEDGDE